MKTLQLLRERDQNNQEQPRARHLEVFTDHQCNLFSTKKSVLQLGLLLCQIDSFLEVGVLDDLFKGKRNLRIQLITLRESMPSY